MLNSKQIEEHVHLIVNYTLGTSRKTFTNDEKEAIKAFSRLLINLLQNINHMADQ